MVWLTIHVLKKVFIAVLIVWRFQEMYNNVFSLYTECVEIFAVFVDDRLTAKILYVKIQSLAYLYVAEN